MTGKERAIKRSEAHNLKPIFQLGKGGINDTFLNQIDEALTARELIKIKVLLESSPINPKDAANEIAEKLNAEVIGVIGGVIILYRYSPELHEKMRKKQANIKKAERIQKANKRKNSKHDNWRNYNERNRDIRGKF